MGLYNSKGLFDGVICGGLICGALRDLVPFIQLKKRENTHEGVLILVQLQASSLQLY